MVKLPLESEAFDWFATTFAFVLMGSVAYWRWKRGPIDANSSKRHWIERLPPRFRTRRGFVSLIAIVAFFGEGGWYLFVKGDGLGWSVLSGIGAAIVAFLLFWPISSYIRGFDDIPGKDHRAHPAGRDSLPP